MKLETKKIIKIYYLVSLLSNASFTLPIYIIFGREYLGFSYTQVAVITFVSFFVMTFFDFIFGIFADSVSRKKSYILGYLLILVSFLPYFLTKDFSIFLYAAVINGLGYALASNSIDTLIHNNLTVEKKVELYPGVISKAYQMVFIGRAIAGVTGGFLYLLNPVYPYLAVSICIFLCIGLSFLIKEEKIKSEKIKNIWGDVYIFFRVRVDLIYFCILGMIMLVFADLLFGYYQPYFVGLKVSPLILGVIYSGISLTSAFGAYLAKQFLEKYNAYLINSIMISTVVITSVVLLIHNSLSLIGPLVMAVGSGLIMPNLKHFLNSESPNKIKTSVASLGTTFYSVGSMVGLFLGGWLADRYDYSFVLSLVILGSLVVLGLNFVGGRVFFKQSRI